MYICILQICVCVSYYVCELLMKRLSYLMLGFNYEKLKLKFKFNYEKLKL